MTDKSEPNTIDIHDIHDICNNVVSVRYNPTIYIIPKLRELSEQGFGVKSEKCKQGFGRLNLTPENCMGDWMETDKDPS